MDYFGRLQIPQRAQIKATTLDQLAHRSALTADQTLSEHKHDRRGKNISSTELELQTLTGTLSQHMHCRPLRSFSWTSNNAGMSQLDSAGNTIFQESPLDRGDESLERAAAAIWVQLAAEAEPESLFLLDTNLTILSHPHLRPLSSQSEKKKSGVVILFCIDCMLSSNLSMKARELEEID